MARNTINSRDGDRRAHRKSEKGSRGRADALAPALSLSESSSSTSTDEGAISFKGEGLKSLESLLPRPGEPNRAHSEWTIKLAKDFDEESLGHAQSVDAELAEFAQRIRDSEEQTAELAKRIQASEERTARLLAEARERIEKRFDKNDETDNLVKQHSKINIYIDKIFARDNSSKSKDARLELLDIHFPSPDGASKISEIVEILFPEISGSAQKRASPVLWKDREAGQTPVSFIRQHYGVWQDGAWERNGLTKPEVRQLDLQLYNALAAWERRHPDDQLGLPTQREEVDRWVDRVASGAEEPKTVVEKERLRSAQRRRGSREPG